MKKIILLAVIVLVLSSYFVISWDPNPVYNPFEVIWNKLNNVSTSWIDGDGKVTTDKNVGIGTVSPGANKLKVQGDTEITGALNITEGAIQDGKILGADIKDNQITADKQAFPFALTLPTPYPDAPGHVTCANSSTSWKGIPRSWEIDLTKWGHTKGRTIVTLGDNVAGVPIEVRLRDLTADQVLSSFYKHGGSLTQLISNEFALPIGTHSYQWEYRFAGTGGGCMGTADWGENFAILLY